LKWQSISRSQDFHGGLNGCTKSQGIDHIQLESEAMESERQDIECCSGSIDGASIIDGIDINVWPGECCVSNKNPER
jgi:hypothetical protein